MTGYPIERLYEEVAFLAFHFHWDYETIMHMDHRERLAWCEEVNKINKNLNENESKKLEEI